MFDTLRRKLFNSIVNGRLVYNTCWEDPRIDRKLLNIDRSSNVLLLTSAGCNALDYLLDDPAAIHCVDSNPAQNALLNMKKALFLHGDPALLWQFFGEGAHDSPGTIYRNSLRRYLAPDSRVYWDQHIDYFNRYHTIPSFYFRGTSGLVARTFYRRIKNRGLYTDIVKLLNARSLEEQRYYYKEIEPQIWSGFYKWIMKRSSTLALLGIPNSQRRLIEQNYGNLVSYIRNRLRRVFTERPLNDNYFWRVYLTGSYTRDCCPNYLRNEYFIPLKNRIKRVKTHTTTLLRYLENSEETYTHIVLLDHQDWMAGFDRSSLKKEWKQILTHSKAGTRILFRSASSGRSFLPGFVQERLVFQDEKTGRLHRQDRVGTYGSTHLGIVNRE